MSRRIVRPAPSCRLIPISAYEDWTTAEIIPLRSVGAESGDVNTRLIACRDVATDRETGAVVPPDSDQGVRGLDDCGNHSVTIGGRRIGRREHASDRLP